MKMLKKIKLKALLFRRHYHSRYHKLHQDDHHHHHTNLLKRLCHKFERLSCAMASSRSCALPSPASPKNRKIIARRSPPSIPRDVHRGSCAVYVGPEHKRFVLKTRYLQHPVFGALLQQSEEEFGYAYSGGLLIPCPVALFEYLLRLLQRNDPWIQSEEATELILHGKTL
ncbi:auxin-responsive protein SAUR41 [Selaginella moellendorffii]|nr:auxin-responsive protein SAUR41 [Selaginella moellendorffii]|eukprot:XP_024524314.1 auxin-responsive protein SAUR41 [Selaginella moellendorffii]